MYVYKYINHIIEYQTTYELKVTQPQVSRNSDIRYNMGLLEHVVLLTCNSIHVYKV